MSSRLRQFILDAYQNRHILILSGTKRFDYPIQIDDQDDNDKLDEFCNIFCIVGSNENFRIELNGSFPITKGMADLAEIYDGFSDIIKGKLVLNLNTEQIEVLMDLADKIRKTSFSGPSINNANWISISARTISSLYRFVRTIKEFKNNKKIF
jgi:hypothetical protein